MTLHLALDTSALHGPPRFDSAHFRALDRLVELQAIKILIPEVVYRELVSQFVESRSAKLLAASHALTEASRWCGDATDTKMVDQASLAVAAVQERHDAAAVCRPLSSWVARTRATILPLEPSQAIRALDGYFVGSPPFRKVRSREDLPDGMIVESLRDAAAAYPDVRLVAGDQRLREAAVAMGLVAYAKLADYLASDEVLAVFKAAHAEENLASLRQVLLEHATLVQSRIGNQWVNALAEFTFESPTIPEDNNEATIQTVDEPTELEIVVDELAFLGDGSVFVPISAKCEVEIYYCIFKSEYYHLSSKRTQSISTSDWNDHYYMATETLSVTVRASLAIDLPGLQLDAGDLSKEALAQALQQASFEIDAGEEVEVNGIDEPDGAR
jgi:rRNA-processing protein FCF1